MKKVLIVDDHDGIRRMLRLALSGRYQLFEAANADDAWELMRQTPPDAVLLDIMMPGYPNGLELLDIVKKNKVMTTKIVMISAKGQYDDVVAAAKLRCNAYIIKPFTRQHLLDTIKTVLESE